MSARTRALVVGAVVALALVVVAIVLLAGDDSSDKPDTTTTSSSSTTTTTTLPPTTTASTQALPPGYDSPEAAIEAYLNSTDRQYAGDCASTTVPDDVGKWCSAQREGTSMWGIGPVASEFGEELTLTQGPDGRWRVTDSTSSPGI